MKAADFRGVIPPMLTSFTRSGEIYERGIREIIRFTLPHVNGYYPLGTYGCGPLMSIDERKKALEIILDEVAGRVPVVAHVGTADTRTTVELALHAKKAGASGVGAIAPYYSPNLSEEALYHHFAELITAVNEDEFPVFLYNNPYLSQNRISPVLLARLAKIGLRGCKDSSFDLVNFFLYQDAIKDYPDFNVIIGTEAIFCAAFEAGATGCVCGLANIYPELLAKLYREVLSCDRKLAVETQRLILQIRQVTKMAATVPVMHFVLRKRGVDAGYPRSPHIDIDDATMTRVEAALRQLGVWI